MFHNWKTQLKQYTDQQICDLNNLQTRWKKLKEYWIVGIELSINEETKTPEYEQCLSFWICQKQIVEFIDLAHTYQ